MAGCEVHLDGASLSSILTLWRRQRTFWFISALEWDIHRKTHGFTVLGNSIHFIWLTYFFRNRLKFIIRSAYQNNIQASLCQLEGDMKTDRFGSSRNQQQIYALGKSETLNLKQLNKYQTTVPKFEIWTRKIERNCCKRKLETHLTGISFTNARRGTSDHCTKEKAQTCWRNQCKNEGFKLILHLPL